VSTRSEVLLWAQRVIARRGQPAHVVLELPADAGADDAQAAFHKIARTAHPDLHRNGLSPQELEMLTSAYAAVAGAYQELRTRTMQTTRMKPIARPEDAAASAPPAAGGPPGRPASAATPPAGMPTARPASAATPTAGTPTARPAPAAAAVRPGAAPPGAAARPAHAAAAAPAAPVAVGTSGTKPETAMSQKALLYYRKAELALKRGDLKGAILQLKLACATDPTSQFLRSALAEVETEVRKSP
jgi:hypothetical protein